MIHILNQIFQWVLNASLMASVMVALVLVVKMVLKDKINAKWQYLLWLLVIVRLLLPWTIESSFSVFNLIDIERDSVQLNQINDENATNLVTINEKVDNQTSLYEHTKSEQTILQQFADSSEDNIISWTTLISIIWLFGVFSLLTYVYLNNKRFVKIIKSGNIVTDQKILGVFSQCQKSMNIRKDIALIKTNLVNSPTLYNSIKPLILLSEKTVHSFTEKELTYILYHELAHFKRNDILVNWLMTGLLILHWFNPILWYAYFRMREDQEMACDAMALSYINPSESTQYGYTIIKLLESYSSFPLTPGVANFSGNKSQLKRRIKMITLFSKSSYKWSILGFVIIILVSSLALTNAKKEYSYKELTLDEVPQEIKRQITEIPYSEETSKGISKVGLKTYGIIIGKPGQVIEIISVGKSANVGTDIFYSVTESREFNSDNHIKIVSFLNLFGRPVGFKEIQLDSKENHMTLLEKDEALKIAKEMNQIGDPNYEAEFNESYRIDPSNIEMHPRPAWIVTASYPFGNKTVIYIDAYTGRLLSVATKVNGGFPYLVVENGDYLRNGELYLKHQYEGIELDLRYLEKTLPYLFQLWGRMVHLETVVENRAVLFSYDGNKTFRKFI